MLFSNALRLGLVFAFLSAACAFMMGGPVFGSSSTPALRAKSAISSLSMSCRRNLKKEKRARNEQMARQYRKPVDKFAGRGGFRAAKTESTNADNEWLSQIYGQHTIYRRDQVEQAKLAAKAAAEAPRQEFRREGRENREVRDPVAA
mmetsp:Transcript_48221/g.100785  ORF Transcript_48221/g.100785 Transcript_48221/m.100785 type:complete len:147 (-) Transcript_48221:192-632(-)